MNVAQANAPGLPVRAALAFAAGALFAVGLALGGMTQPSKVIGFLDFFGEWDPALAAVMGGAVMAYTPIYWWSQRRLKRPFFDLRFVLPTRKDIDVKLVLGAMLFGAGWGLGGFCPGPALASIGVASATVAVFVLAMLAGMFVHDQLATREII